MLISLPLTSVLAIIWLYRDTNDKGEVTDLSWSILWVISRPSSFFVMLPFLLRSLDFWPALLLACAATAVSYAIWVWVARRIGLDL